MFENFYGNPAIAEALGKMAQSGRLPQTLLFAGPEGVGKATLARRLAAALLDRPDLIERDDLSLPENREIVAAREKWPADKRNQDPLFFSSHPDFVTFPPDGPLRQVSIEQARLLRERAPFKPMRGNRRVFLIDHIDRANEQAANSLLKTLEEPPEHLVMILTAENAYDLLPTIRSRAVPFQFAPLAEEDMSQFAQARRLDQSERRIALAGGSPGLAVELDLEQYDKRRAAMLALVKSASGAEPFSAWLPYGETLGRSRTERLEPYLKVLYDLLRDVMILREGGAAIRNQDLRRELESAARKIDAAWLRLAVKQVDEIVELLRRNIQRTIALDALVLALRGAR